MSERFQLGEKVEWYAVAGGRDGKRHDKRHAGKVVAVVPANQYMEEFWEMGFYRTGQPRNHESYIVCEPGKRRGKLYWPRVSQLRLFDGREIGCEK